MNYHEEQMAKIPDLNNDELLREFKFSMFHTKVVSEVAERQKDKSNLLESTLQAMRLGKEYTNALEAEIGKRMDHYPKSA